MDPTSPNKNRLGIDYKTVSEYAKKYRMIGRDIYFLYSQFQGMHEIVKNMIYAEDKPDTIFTAPRKSEDPEQRGRPQNGGPQDYDYT